MENILQWGVNIIRLIQSLASPPLTGFMIGVTWSGSTLAYLILIPLIYWCIDEKKGFRLALAVLVSAWLNITLKFLLNQPRPFFAGYDPSLQMIPESMGGLPSGHAQNALVFWIIIASWIKKKWAYIAAALICLALSFSRVYLGVHFPSDIFGGWILGGAVLCVYFLPGPKIEALLDKGGKRAQMICAALVSFIMILYRPAETLLVPGAVFMGLGIGGALNIHYVKFKSRLSGGRSRGVRFSALLVRFLLGTTVGVLIYVLFGKMTSVSQGASWYFIAYFVRYALIGLWISAGAPWLYCVLRLAEKRTENENPSGTEEQGPPSE